MNWRNYKTKIWRRFSSITYGLLLKVLFGVKGLYDPQSGFKVYKRQILERISPLTSNGFEIDSEILVKALRKGYRIDYLPIVYTYKGNSKVDMLRDPLRMFISVLMWKVKGIFNIEDSVKTTVVCRSFQARTEVEREAAGYDQGQVGYESRNPLVKLFFSRKIEEILKVTSIERNGSTLDVGCGDGCLLSKLEGGLKVGIDLSATRLRRARFRAPDASLVCGDAEHLPFKKSAFDFVTCLDVLEHLHNPHGCIRDLEFSSVEGGTIFVSVPNDRLLSFARFLVARCPFSLKGHGHIHSLKPSEIAKNFPSCRLSSFRKVPTSLLPIITLIWMKKDGTKPRNSLSEITELPKIQ